MLNQEELILNTITMNVESPTILDLPIEILEIIFSHLKFKDRMSATLVCHRWNITAIRWSKVLLRLTECSDVSALEVILASNRPYKHLDLQDDCFTSKLISKFRDSLVTLEVKQVKSWDWMNALCGLPRLLHLHMQCSSTCASPYLRSSQSCPSMRSLAIDKIDYHDFCFLRSFISDTFPGLVSLRLREFYGDFSICRLPNLEILEVIGNSIIYDELLQDLKALPKLRCITFTGRMFECNYPAESLNIEQIRTVVIRTNLSINNEDLLQLTKVFPAMTSCTVNNCITNCTVAGINVAKQRLPNCTFDIVPADSIGGFWSGFDLDIDSD